jgi:gluconate kinase
MVRIQLAGVGIMYPIWFILGPSGVGKTTVSREIAERQAWLWYEIDEFSRDDGKNGIDAEAIRNEWDVYWERYSPSKLIQTLLARMKHHRKQGVILSFSSTLILQDERLRPLKGNIDVVYLYGTKAQCLEAFLARERDKRRNLTVDIWKTFNTPIFKFLESEECAHHKLSVFENQTPQSKRRTHDAIERDLLSRPR